MNTGKNKVFWLQYKDSNVAFLQFTVISNEKVHVKGPLGCTYYIDSDKTTEEARKFWKEQVENGYHQIDSKNAPNSILFNAYTYGN